MNKTVVGVVLIIAAALLIGFFIYTQNTRYSLQTVSQKGAAYKTDRRTGKTWVVYGDTELIVKPPFTPYEAPEDKAIRLTKDSYIFEAESRTEDMIKNWLGEEKGNLRIIGWDAKKIDDQTYFVSYTYKKDSGEAGYFFEVNLMAEIVRNIKDDPELEKKYEMQLLLPATKPASIPTFKPIVVIPKAPKPKIAPQKAIEEKEREKPINVKVLPESEKKYETPPAPPTPEPLEEIPKTPESEPTPTKPVEEKEVEIKD